MPLSRSEWGGRWKREKLFRGFNSSVFGGSRVLHRIYLSCFKSPIAAREMYLEIKKRVLGLAEFPQAAISYASPVSGNKRYKITYKNYDIHYVVDDKYVRVLGIKHQLQNDNWIE